MNARVQALIEQARHLNRDECLIVLDILQKLVSPPDAAWEAAWTAESKDRLAAYERGDIEAEEFDVAMELNLPGSGNRGLSLFFRRSAAKAPSQGTRRGATGMSENHRVPDYLEHIQQAATDACSFRCL